MLAGISPLEALLESWNTTYVGGNMSQTVVTTSIGAAVVLLINFRVSGGGNIGLDVRYTVVCFTEYEPLV